MTHTAQRSQTGDTASPADYRIEAVRDPRVLEAALSEDRGLAAYALGRSDVVVHRHVASCREPVGEPQPARSTSSATLPVLARLYLNKSSAAKWKRAYRTKPELMLEMLKLLHAHDPGQKLHFLGDSAYTSSTTLKQIPGEIAVTGRI